MKRISKGLAASIAKKMVDSTIGEKIKLEQTEMQLKALKHAIIPINNDVMSCFNKYPNYFTTCRSVGFTCGPLHDVFIDLPERLPSSDGWRVYAEISSVDYEYFKMNMLKIADLRDKSTQLINKIEATLINLSSSKRIKEQFPEAYEFIPTESETCTEIALPIEEIKDLLLQYK